MPGASRDPRAWGCLVVLGLWIWTGARADGLNPVTSLRMQNRTNSSITLTWTAPQVPDQPPYTYWVQWLRENITGGTQNTSDTSITVKELEAGTLYNFTVWAERNGVNSTEVAIVASTVPNTVTGLRMQDRNTSSITLTWTAPQGPEQPPYTYWVQWLRENITGGTQNTSDTNITVKELEAGTLYNFTVWAERNGVNSTEVAIVASTVPNTVTGLGMQDRNTSSITLTWTAPQVPDQPPYTYWVQWLRENITGGTQNTSDTNITVKELEAGTLYNFTVWAERNGVNSTEVAIVASTVPNTVTGLRMQDRNTSSITLTWTAPQGPEQPPYTYWVQWLREDIMGETQNTSDTNITVKELEAGTLYNFTVWAERNGANSTEVAIVASTVPNTVTSLRRQDQNTSSITLTWTAPQGPEQPPYTYWVQWLREDFMGGTQNTSDTNITVKELEAGTLYNFTVWAERNGANSTEVAIVASTVPNEATDLRNVTQTSNSVTLRWMPPTDPYSSHYIYWVQWASGGQPQREKDLQRDEVNQTGKTNETWYIVKALSPGTVYNFSIWVEMNNVSSSTQSLLASTAPDPVTITSCVSTSGGYGVILTWSCPSGGYEVFVLEVGGQQDFHDRSSCGRKMSISGLQPAQSYQATVTTVWDGMRASPASITCYTENAGVIAGAIVGVLLFLVLVGLLVFFLKKRKKKQEDLEHRNLLSYPGDILAEDFADHVRKNEKDSSYGFGEEYQQLALVGQDQLHTVASAPENSTKNRYRNVLPYDWSRVPLKPLHGEPGSDYINASFMPGLWSSQEFIAAQGPLPQTVGDFWRLVWEQQSHTLVMLTNCVESGRVKCEHYWPLDSQPCTHGCLQVTLVDEEVTENWTMRDLKLFHLEEQKTLAVRQLHYVAWPDHGVPDSPDPLLAFWKVLRKCLDQRTWGGPPIVHCSAGVGRTGTLIALDVLLRQLECEGLVGPFSFVRKMRGSRPLMVQTEAQYVFLHQCILQFLQQSSLAPEEKAVTDKNVPDVIYENVAAVLDQELEISAA